MENQLRNIIREAFHIAYSTHKAGKLLESSEDLKLKMSSGDVYAAEAAFRAIKENPKLAMSYGWTPEGSANRKLTQAQFNLLVELVHENTDLETQKMIFMGLYNDRSPALINRASAFLTGKKGTNVTQEEAAQALEVAWNEMFLGEKYKSGEGMKKSFADAAAEYSSVANKRGAISNFGAYLMTRLLNAASSALRDMVSNKTVSLDSPSLTTGKPTDVAGEEGGEDDTLNYGKGATDDDYNEDETNLYQPETDGFDVADTTPEQKKVQDLVEALVLSLNEAIEDMQSYMPNASDTQKEALGLLKKVIETGESNTEEANKINSALKKGKFGKLFTNTVNRYFFENGFTNPDGHPMNFEDLGIVSLAKLIKLKNANYQKIDEVQLDENLNWIIEGVILEKFISKNMNKIMERVYKKLSKNL